jgi:membrane-associated phospholipid phosphatase
LKSAALKLLLLLLAFTLSISAFALIAHEFLWEKEVALDTAVSDYVKEHFKPGHLDAYMTTLSFLASAYVLIPVYLILVIWHGWIKRKFLLALYILSTGLSGFLIIYLLKLLFRRPRPAGGLIPQPSDFSFPSGHSSAAFIFYGLLIYLIWRIDIRKPVQYGVSALLILLSLLIGFSRIFLRVHYASDVLAGFCIGAAWLSLSIGMINRIARIP